MGSVTSQILAARALRERLQADPHRPRYHLIPPEGWFNDANGALYWSGRYHIFYLGRTPIPDVENPGEERWVEVWDHASSADLTHWTFHRPALEPETDGSTPLGIWSGGAVAGAPRPTLIYHVPGQGTCIAVSDDPMLEYWTPLAENPVIPITDSEEYTVFDPCAWKEPDGYYALVGNRNRRPGFEGDSTSLFRSPDLRTWKYAGPFYASRREWTAVTEDAACPDFFALGDRHMLLVHGHRPYFQCHYYLGRYEDHRFEPEEHGRMNWPGGQISGPETLLDGLGRRIFFGWVMEADSESGERDWKQTGWASVMSLPRLLEMGTEGELRITPVPELRQLRTNHQRVAPRPMPDGPDIHDPVAGVSGECLELDLEIDPGQAARVGVAVRSSPGREEETLVFADLSRGTMVIDFAKSTLNSAIRYPRRARDASEPGSEADRFTTSQEAPFPLARSEPVHLHLFLDRSILEVFVNERICMTQRIYPTRHDSTGVRLLADRPGACLLRFDSWEVGPASPW